MAELGFVASSHQLERKTKLTAAVWPLRLPWSKAQVRPRQVCSVAGWGKVTPMGSFSDTLQEVELTVQQDRKRESYLHNYHNSTTQLCVGNPKEKKSSFTVRLGIFLAGLWGEGCLGIWRPKQQGLLYPLDSDLSPGKRREEQPECGVTGLLGAYQGPEMHPKMVLHPDDEFATLCLTLGTGVRKLLPGCAAVKPGGSSELAPILVKWLTLHAECHPHLPAFLSLNIRPKHSPTAPSWERMWELEEKRELPLE